MTWLLVALLMVIPVRVTVYHPVKAQTDSNPFETADGTVYQLDEIPDRRIAAVSQDLLARNNGPIQWGDRIYVDVPDDRFRGWWSVHDTMATEFYNKECDCMLPVENFVDLLVGENVTLQWKDARIYTRREDNVCARAVCERQGGELE